jgi:hypothetical protein
MLNCGFIASNFTNLAHYKCANYLIPVPKKGLQLILKPFLLFINRHNSVKYQLVISHNFTNPPSEPFNFQRYFFNEDEHLQNQGGESCYTFYCQNLENQTIDIRFSVIIQDGIAHSPLRATFGGVEFNEQVSEKDLFDFLKEVMEYLSDLSIKEAIINSYPDSYLPEQQNQKLENCLFRLSFQTKYVEHNYEISITEKSFYETVISSNHKRILRNAVKNNFIFKQEINPDLPKIHAFIERSRVRKSRPMTMSLLQLEGHFKKFSKRFKIFSVYNSEDLMAVCVTVEINDRILYTLYPADAEEYVKKSPLIFLFSGIYEYYQQQKYTILDLGIATDKGILNEGLARFKRNIGGELSKKKTYLLWYAQHFH